VADVIGAADDLWLPAAVLAKPLELEMPPRALVKQDAASRSPAQRQGLPSTYQMRHDAHYVEELDARTLHGRGTARDMTADRPVVSRPAISTNEAAGKRLASLVVVAALGVVLSAAGVWFVRSGTGQRSETTAIEPAPESTTSRVDPPPVPSQTPESTSLVATSGPPTAPAPLTQDPGASPSAGAPKFVVRMATFRTKARAIEAIRELGAAGYSAFSAEVELRDGARAFTVSLGPYTERAAAAEDLERAQRTPGYASGRVVEIDQ
jgi:cell division septation protein DedD